LKRGRHRERVEDVQNGDRDDGGDVEPERDVEVALASDLERAEKVPGEDHPDQGDGNVNRPLQLRVLLAGGDAQRQGQRRADDDGLPAPEVDARQGVVEHPCLEQALRGVVDGRENRVAGESEDDRVGVERPQAPEGEVFAEVEDRAGQLQRDDQSDQHSDDAPDDRGIDEFADDVVVVREAFQACAGRGGWVVRHVGAGHEARYSRQEYL
jgi:hypothetical protein